MRIAKRFSQRLSGSPMTFAARLCRRVALPAVLLAILTLWIRSYWFDDLLSITRPTRVGVNRSILQESFELVSAAGGISLSVYELEHAAPQSQPAPGRMKPYGSAP